MIRAYADNVILRLEPLDTVSSGGIHLVQGSRTTKGHRAATVLASGPGYHTSLGVLVPNEVDPGDRVVVDALAGDTYDWELSPVRHNVNQTFEALDGVEGEIRVVRHDEILGVIEG